jgi:hypothetical protein
MKESELLSYFKNETDGFVVKDITLVETKASYLWQVKCYLIETEQGTNFYVFDSDTLPLNLYPITNGFTLDMYYYMHIGLMSELCSQTTAKNFILDFLNDFSIFPVLDRRLSEISKDITLNKNASQLSSIANQIRDCYLNLTDYLMNKVRTHNPEFKNDNFKENLQEFLELILPGPRSETRRNTINGIAQKGWKLNAELVHKDSVTIFDILISFNTLKLIISIINNLIVGNNMPFNRIKCPNCQGEKNTVVKNSDCKEYEYVCKDCKTHFFVNPDKIIKNI